MGYKRCHIAGQRFGRLTAIEPRRKGKKYAWLCQCDCGGSAIVPTYCLRIGETRSCGCYRRERTSAQGRANTKHGMRHTPLYRIWIAMRVRCNDPNNDNYPNYGGRGIRVCARWDSFTAFANDMGPRPRGMTLDRINNDGDYEPGNCRWATAKEQSRNSRGVRPITFRGRTMLLEDWAAELRMSQAGMWSRLAKWPIERALTEPNKNPNRTRGPR